MAKQNMKDIIASRTARDVVVPISPFTLPSMTSQLAEKPASSEAEKSGSLEAQKSATQRARKPASREGDESASREVQKMASREDGQPASGRVKKFGTYLREDSIKQLRLIAMQEDREVKQIIQELVDAFLKSKRR